MATALDVVNGQKLIEQFRPNLVFLDIQMPGGTGFDMLKSLPLRAFEVIFVTAYDQYAIQAIKVSAVDYLLKPINSEDLKQAVKKPQKKSMVESKIIHLKTW